MDGPAPADALPAPAVVAVDGPAALFAAALAAQAAAKVAHAAAVAADAHGEAARAAAAAAAAQATAAQAALLAALQAPGGAPPPAPPPAPPAPLAVPPPPPPPMLSSAIAAFIREEVMARRVDGRAVGRAASARPPPPAMTPAVAQLIADEVEKALASTAGAAAWPPWRATRATAAPAVGGGGGGGAGGGGGKSPRPREPAAAGFKRKQRSSSSSDGEDDEEGAAADGRGAAHSVERALRAQLRAAHAPYPGGGAAPRPKAATLLLRAPKEGAARAGGRRGGAFAGADGSGGAAVGDADGASSEATVPLVSGAVVRAKMSDLSSGFHGVFKNRGGERWSARIKDRGRRFNLGSYTDVADAARAYDCALHTLRPSATDMLNFPLTIAYSPVVRENVAAAVKRGGTSGKAAGK